jgi:predicted transcriptional regulator with HTH domain
MDKQIIQSVEKPKLKIIYLVFLLKIWPYKGRGIEKSFLYEVGEIFNREK